MPMFRPASAFPVGSSPVSNATADLNGDGHLDILTSNYISDNVSVLFGDGNGSFTAGTPVPVTNGPREIEVGDLDGDGDIDAVVTNYSGGNVSVLLNDGTGNFTTSSVPVGTIPRGIALGDLDGDGDLDFIAVNYGTDTVSVMLNNGTGSFTQAAGSPIAVGPDPVATVLGDFDGDDDLDIAVTINDDDNVGIFLNDGAGGFVAAAPVATGNGPRGIASGDFDGDGDLDLVATDFLANTLSILINDGSGAFTRSSTVATASNPYSVAAGDLDGDGDLDIAANNSGSVSVSVFVNDGTGTFTAASGSPFAVGAGGGGILFADFDEDGDLDISTTNFSANSMSILLNNAFYAVTAGSALEGTPPGAGGELVFTISRTDTSAAEDVTYTLGGTATGSDYTAPSGVASFAVGESTAEVRIAITADGTYEADESVVLTIVSVSGTGYFSAASGTATGTILNDDNHAPSGTSSTIAAVEDTARVLTAAVFGFSDGDGNALAAVRITTLPGSGTLTNNGVAVTAGQLISVADINAGKLVFKGAPNANGNGYAQFTFQVQDNGGTVGGGVDLDQSPNTLTINVAAVNDAPSGTNRTLVALEDTPRAFSAADFGFSDADGNALAAVRITTLPGAGRLILDGVAVGAGQLISIADIDAGKLAFRGALNASGNSYAQFTFQVQDNGGTASGGVNLDQSPNTLTFNMRPVNDAPSGTNKSLTVNEDTAYQLKAADFGFSDTDGNAFAAVRIATLPAFGRITNNGVAVAAGQLVSIADINAGRLKFTPLPNSTADTGFSFQVKDNGGTANGGVDLDPAANRISFDVTPVDDAPSGTNKTVSANEDLAYQLKAADFGFNDVDGNAFAAVRITTLPDAGRLTFNGIAVGAGQLISIADINAGKLAFIGALNASGNSYARLTFQVQDNGGTATGGVNLDQSPNTLTFNVTPINDAPTAVVLSNIHGPLADNISTASAIKIADIAVTDVDGGANVLSLAGADAALFQIAGGDLWLRAGATLDFDTNPRLDVIVNIDGVGVGRAVDAFKTLAIGVTKTTITGTPGPDTLTGTVAGDRIVGLAGVDVMTGGAGKDVFVFSAISDSAPGQSGYVNNGAISPIAGQGLRDIITDFTPGSDKLDFAAMDASTIAAGNQAFAWLGAGNFSFGAGQLIFRQFDAAGTANDKTIVYGDINGDARADFQVELTGLKALVAGDFVL